MAKNLIPEIARMLGVELGEEFMLKDANDNYVTYGGEKEIFCFGDNDFYNVEGGAYSKSDFLQYILCGTFEIVKIPWRPKVGEDYYTFNAMTHNDTVAWAVDCFTWHNWPSDFALFEKGWVYRTREEAEAALPAVTREVGVNNE